MTLDELLDAISVVELDECETPPAGLIGEWYAVLDEDGVVAWFASEADAYRCRLDIINRRLHP